MIMGLPSSGSHMGSEIGRIRGETSDDEVVAGHPMLSFVVVAVNG